VGYTTGEYPRAVAVADVNHDGKKDLIVDNVGNHANAEGPEPGSIAVLLGNGNGTFQSPPTQYTPFDYPGWLTSADFNGDGSPDVAVTRLYDGHFVNVLFGHVPITVQTPTVFHVSPASGPVAGGTVVTITGANFVDVMSVKFGAYNATSFTLQSSTTLVATAPAEAAGVVDVVVSNAAGAAGTTSADHFTFTTSSTTLPAPVVIGPGSTTQPGPTITTLTPTFTWHPVTVAGVTGYQLNLYDITQQKFTSFVINGAATSSFTLPTADALTVGDSFVWNLRVLSGTKSGPPSTYLYFQTHA